MGLVALGVRRYFPKLSRPLSRLFVTFRYGKRRDKDRGSLELEGESTSAVPMQPNA